RAAEGTRLVSLREGLALKEGNESMLEKIAAVAIVAATFGIPRVAAAQDVRPFVECVNVERRGQTQIIAYFGYINLGTETITEPAGTGANFFLPPPADVGQLSVFEPGEHHFAVVTHRPIGNSLTWILQGHRVTADATSLPCPSYLFYRGNWIAGTQYFDGDV